MENAKSQRGVMDKNKETKKIIVERKGVKRIHNKEMGITVTLRPKARGVTIEITPKKSKPKAK